MAEKYIELNLNDEKSGKIAEVLSNKTAKKILGLLAEEELSEGDIAKKLKLAANTTNYNIKKLVNAGLIEKTSNFFWSVKGKKILIYRLANKKIIISTKNSFKSLIVSSIFGGMIFGAGKLWMNHYNNQALVNNIASQDRTYEAAPAFMAKTSETALGFIQTTSLWSNVLIWAFIGLCIGLIAYILYKKMKGGFEKRIKI